jgi:hypothetical protein
VTYAVTSLLKNCTSVMIGASTIIEFALKSNLIKWCLPKLYVTLVDTKRALDQTVFEINKYFFKEFQQKIDSFRVSPTVTSFSVAERTLLSSTSSVEDGYVLNTNVSNVVPLVRKPLK